MCCRNCSLCYCCSMTKVSSTYLLHNLGGFTADVRALCSNNFMYKFATTGLPGDPIAYPLGLFIKLALEQEICVVRKEFQQFQDVVNGHGCSLMKLCVLLKFLFFVTSIADCTGMDVNRADTSYEMMHSPFSSLILLISSANSLELLTWWMVFHSQGFQNSSQHVCYPICHRSLT